MSRWLKYFFVVWAANLVLFFITTAYLGGDALNGKSFDGHYFLSNHGHLTEVSHGIFLYSTIHSIVFIALGLLAVPLAFIANRQRKKS